MTKLELFKSAVSVVVGLGTSKIINGIVKNNVETNNTVDQVTVFTGSAVIGAIVADMTKDYTDNKIDELIELWKTLKTPTEN